MYLAAVDYRLGTNCQLDKRYCVKVLSSVEQGREYISEG